jgi:hypothetical protein
MSKLDGLTTESLLGARNSLIWRMSDVPGKNGEPDQVALSCQGAVLTLPAYARTPLEFAISTPRFRAGDLPGDLDDEGKLVLLRRLVREGLIVFTEPDR